MRRITQAFNRYAPVAVAFTMAFAIGANDGMITIQQVIGKLT